MRWRLAKTALLLVVIAYLVYMLALFSMALERTEPSPMPEPHSQGTDAGAPMHTIGATP